MLWEVLRYFSYGWINTYYIKPDFYFTYSGFHWVKPLVPAAMYTVWVLIGICSILIALGLFYRMACVLFFFLFSYIFLLSKAHYLNHFYFVILISFIMIFINPHRSFSLDIKRGAIKKSDTILNWELWLLRFQIGVVYFFGGLAKIDPDWISGVPLNKWINPHKSIPLIGDILSHKLTPLLLSWSGLFLDLFIVPALLYKRTRPFALLSLALFHISNHFLFKIGIFPWFSLGISFLFLASDFPLKIYEALKKVQLKRPKIPKVKKLSPLTKKQKYLATGISLFVLYNCLMPLRQHFYKGDTHWTELGHSYAWRMKLRDKKVYDPTFYFYDKATGDKWQEKASYRLRKRQWRIMGGHPEMILDYVSYLRKNYERKGRKNLRIRVKAYVSLNFRKKQRIIKKHYNLENISDCTFCNPDWINPLELDNKRSFKKVFNQF
jgi:vitamin K-dependent gamma-carboxylase